MKTLGQNDGRLIRASEAISSVGHAFRELIENSLDSGATVITCKVLGSGTQSITVSDNGSGIPREGMEILCTEGATSKQYGGTLNGGRGKALDAIAAMSSITIESSTDGINGLRLTFDDDGNRHLEKMVRNKGTTVIVQDLFSPFPARRVYIIEHQYQMSDEVKKVAASFAVATMTNFSLNLDNKMSLQVNGSSRGNRVRSILDDSVAKGLVEGGGKLDGWNDEATLEFYASTPTTASGGNIILVVNGRPCLNASIVKAIKQEFKLCAGPIKPPTVILYIDAPHGTFMHVPNSPLIGIEFQKSPELQSRITQYLKEAWTKESITPTFKKPAKEMSPMISPKSQPTVKSIRSASTSSAKITKNITDEEILERMSNATRYQEDFGPIPESISIPQFNEMDIIGQWNKSFILTRLGGSIIAIDQHAACEAQNFEKLRKAKNGKKQKLIQPILVTVSPDDLENAATYKERMSQLGFDYRIEDDKILVESIPTNETVSTGICDFQELLSRINDVPESTPMTTNARKQLAYHACHSSAVVGDTMSKTQMRKLLDRMGSSDAPWNCPHGRPTWCCLFNLNDGKPEPFYEG